jgi:hypothetical protein
MGLAIKVAFTNKQTKPPQKNLIKKGCTLNKLMETTRIGTYAL